MYIHQPAPYFQAQKRTIVLLPVGSCEQHGPYLPVDTDLRIAALLAENVARKFAQDCLLLPALPFSCAHEHRGLGTIALDVHTVALFVHNVARSLKTWETVCLLILVNWHGGNDLLGALATEISATEALPTAALPTPAQVGKAWDESHMTSAKEVHAGAIETAIVKAFWPELVGEPIPRTAHDEPDIRPAKAQAVLQAIGSMGITTQGIWGAPEDAKPQSGVELIEKLSLDTYVQIRSLRTLLEAS